ncbi:hypothetical protein [Streptomyces sp. NPDC001640]
MSEFAAAAGVGRITLYCYVAPSWSLERTLRWRHRPSSAAEPTRGLLRRVR